MRWKLDFDADFIAEIDEVIGEVGGGGDGRGNGGCGSGEGEQAFCESGGIALVCGLLDFGFYVVEVDGDFVLLLWRKLGNGLAQAGDQLEQFSGGSVVLYYFVAPDVIAAAGMVLIDGCTHRILLLLDNQRFADSSFRNF